MGCLPSTVSNQVLGESSGKEQGQMVLGKFMYSLWPRPCLLQVNDSEKKKHPRILFIVGGFNPSEKMLVEIRSSPQFGVEIQKLFEEPPPSSELT